MNEVKSWCSRIEAKSFPRPAPSVRFAATSPVKQRGRNPVRRARCDSSPAPAANAANLKLRAFARGGGGREADGGGSLSGVKPRQFDRITNHA